MSVLDKNVFLVLRSELARLGTKRNVPNVAVRRKEFESRAADWRQNRESRSLDSTSGELIVFSLNRKNDRFLMYATDCAFPAEVVSCFSWLVSGRQIWFRYF